MHVMTLRRCLFDGAGLEFQNNWFIVLSLAMAAGAGGDSAFLSKFTISLAISGKRTRYGHKKSNSLHDQTTVLAFGTKHSDQS